MARMEVIGSMDPRGIGFAAPTARPRHVAILLYLAIPLLISVSFGLRGPLPGVGLSILLFVVHVVPAWWYDGLLSWAVYRLLARWRPPTIVIVSLGAFLAGFVSMAHFRVVHVLTGDLFSGLNDPSRLPPVAFTSAFVHYYVRQHVVGILLWAAANLFLDRFAGVPRYRYASHPAPTREAATPAAADSTATVPPAFARRLPDHLGSTVLAVEAEEHYVKVHTDRGSALVLYRFSDALADLAAAPGLRVHRSYWVRRDAIRAVRRNGRCYQLELVNGLVVPVSLSYRGTLDSAGVTEGAILGTRSP